MTLTCNIEIAIAQQFFTHADRFQRDLQPLTVLLLETLLGPLILPEALAAVSDSAVSTLEEHKSAKCT